MATVQLNAQDFEKTITDNNLVFVDFWATWCGPCRAFGPTFEAASEENPDIVFGKVDIDANQDLASAAGIQAVPTLMIAKQGQPRWIRPLPRNNRRFPADSAFVRHGGHAKVPRARAECGIRRLQDFTRSS